MPRSSVSSLGATIVDAASLFDAAEFIGERHPATRVTVQYARLRERLDAMRAAADWQPATVNSIILSIDPNSEGQQRFLSMLGHVGFEPDVVYFRDSFVSLPVGRSPNELTSKPITSLASRIAYIAGLMARFEAPQLLVVSHSFELHGPLQDLARRVPRGKIGLAYFASLLDYRWRLAGLMENKLDIEFFDLDPFGSELVGVDLIAKPQLNVDTKSGLSRY